MPKRKKAPPTPPHVCDHGTTLLSHWAAVQQAAQAAGDNVDTWDYARCFLYGAMSVLCLLSTAAATGDAAVYGATVHRLERDVDALLDAEGERCQRTH